MTADIARLNTAAEGRLIEQFRSAQGSIPGLPSGWRAKAIEDFAKAGLPHRRLEAWHYTDLRSTMREAYEPAALPDVAAIVQARAKLSGFPAASARAVLIDGYYVPDLSFGGGDGFTIRSLLDVMGEGPSGTTDRLAVSSLQESESILALNAAFMQGGVIVTVAADATVPQPIEIVLFTSDRAASAATTRSLVQAGPRSRSIVIERHEVLGQVPSQGNHVLVFDIEEGAALDHAVSNAGTIVGVQQVATVIADLGASCDFKSFALVSGSGFVRRQGFVRFNGPDAKGAIRGVTVLDETGHADTTLVVTHNATHCESRELFKHILDGESTGVFQGKVIVAPGAQKTDGKMMSRAIFLADGATMYNKPELEIFADDVVCGHGATAGFLDEEQMFYLRARGVPKKEAEALLLQAFAAEAIEDVGTEVLRIELTESVEQWLRQRQA